MFSSILFDLDGTLTDPGQGITNSVAYALERFGIRVADRTALYPFIGPPLQDSFAEHFGFSKEDCERAVGYYREYFREKGIFENEVYDGIGALLSSLRGAGRQVVLATSKPEPFAETILRHFDLFGYFTAVCGATMDSARSRKADVIAYALEKCGVRDLSTAVMVGDREHDIQGAKSVGISSVGVLYGYGSLPELQAAGADYIAETVEALGALLLA